jgi:hypothetical protein
MSFQYHPYRHCLITRYSVNIHRVRTISLRTNSLLDRDADMCVVTFALHMQMHVRILPRAEWAVRIPAHRTNLMLVSPARIDGRLLGPLGMGNQFSTTRWQEYAEKVRMACTNGTPAVCIRQLARLLTVLLSYQSGRCAIVHRLCYQHYMHHDRTRLEEN